MGVGTAEEPTVPWELLVEPKPPLLGLPTTLQKVALISSMHITSVVGPCDEDGEDCPSGCVMPCAKAGEVNAAKATVNWINLIASQPPFGGRLGIFRRRGAGLLSARHTNALSPANLSAQLPNGLGGGRCAFWARTSGRLLGFFPGFFRYFP